jgi:hypothetical protein
MLATNWLTFPILRSNGGSALLSSLQIFTGNSKVQGVTLFLFSRPPLRQVAYGSVFDLQAEDATYCLGAYPIAVDRFVSAVTASIGSMPGVRIALKNSTNLGAIYVVPVALGPTPGGGAPPANFGIDICAFVN